MALKIRGQGCSFSLARARVCVCIHHTPGYLFSRQVTELATVKRPQERAYALQRWQEMGGVMIIGYEMYRNLTQGRNIKSKKLKETFQKTLVDPGTVLSLSPTAQKAPSLMLLFVS